MKPYLIECALGLFFAAAIVVARLATASAGPAFVYQGF
jgi:hypothetical protein